VFFGGGKVLAIDACVIAGASDGGNMDALGVRLGASPPFNTSASRDAGAPGEVEAGFLGCALKVFASAATEGRRIYRLELRCARLR
jgi:hypothetical protein